VKLERKIKRETKKEGDRERDREGEKRRGREKSVDMYYIRAGISTCMTCCSRSHIVGAGNAPGEPWFTWEMNVLSRTEHAVNIREASSTKSCARL